MNKGILKAILQRAWYPEVMFCRLCNCATHELIRVMFRIPYYKYNTFRASACPDCVRDMQPSQAASGRGE